MASPYPDYGPHRRRHSFEGGNESETQLHPYPPTTPSDRPDSSSTLTIAPKSDPNVAEDRINRTPSPTPSEARELKTGAIDWKSLLKWRFWIRREWAWYYVIIIVIVTITALVSIFHKEIVQWLKPAATWLHNLPFGWLVPIGILFVISFPPLFGHEIVAILCGLVWGLWIGFGIVAAGTFLGEVGNFYAFKYCCRSRGEKLERTKLSYACLAKVVRDGGFRIALAARLSAIPGHFTTAVFSTCGMGIFVFSLAAILSLPKQFVTVYLGVILEQSESGESTTTSKLISNIVLGVTILITIAAMWYILHQMNKVKPEIIYAKRKARQAKLARAGLHPTSSDTTLSGSTVDVDLTDSGMIPLKPKSNVYAPQPQRPSAYTNPYDMQDDSPDSDPDAYNYTQMRQGGRRSRSRGRGGDMLSIVREDSDEVGWDMAPAGMPLPTADPSYSPIPTAHGIANANMPTRQPIAGRTSSDNPYITSRGTLSPRQTQTHSLPPHNEIRPPSQASHIITFDPDTVTVSSAPNTPDLTLPTPPYTQDAFAANTTQYQPRTNVNTSSYPPQLTSTYPLQQQQQHRRVNPELSPFRDPIPIPVHLSSQQFSLTHASQSTPNLVPMTAEVHRSFTEYAAQRQQQEQQMQSHSLHTSPEIVGRPPPFASNGNVPTRSDSWGTNSNIGPAIPPPQYEQAVFGGPGSVNSNAPMRDRHGGHDGEPSDATYHTAWGSGHSTDRSDFR